MLSSLREISYRAGLARSTRLPGPTVSIGNLSMGGTGKSPLVQYLTDYFLEQGKKPLVLTRGYGRKHKQPVFLAPGQTEDLDPSRIGDEAAMLKFRSPLAAVLVHPKRARLAAKYPEYCPYILDDGFQHWQAYRDVDIVLWDAMQSLKQRALPFGRLREPTSALGRADVIILSRADQVSAQSLQRTQDEIQEICRRVRSQRSWPWRSQQPRDPLILRTRHAPKCLRKHGTAQEFPLELLTNHSVFLFSGIARPQSFYKTIETLGAQILEAMVFADHHYFSEADIQQISRRWEGHGRPLLLTTEKDYFRDPRLAAKLSELYSLEVRMQFLGEDEAHLQAFLQERIVCKP